jgi:hypothetical protein
MKKSNIRVTGIAKEKGRIAEREYLKRKWQKVVPEQWKHDTVRHRK